MSVNLIPWREQQAILKKRFFNVLYIVCACVIFLVELFFHFHLIHCVSQEEARNLYLKKKIFQWSTAEASFLQPAAVHYQELLHEVTIIRQVYSEYASLFTALVEIAKSMPNDARLVSFKKVNNTITLQGEVMQSDHLLFFLQELENHHAVQQIVLDTIEENKEKKLTEFKIAATLMPYNH